MRTPSRIFTSSSVTSHSYQDVSPDLEEYFVKVFVNPLQVSVMLSGFSANTFAAMASRSSLLVPHLTESMQPLLRVLICVFMLLPLVLFAGSFPLTLLYIEFYFTPVNRLNKTFSRIFRNCRFSFKNAYLFTSFYINGQANSRGWPFLQHGG